MRSILNDDSLLDAVLRTAFIGFDFVTILIITKITLLL